MQQAIPGAKLVIIPKCGHVPQIEQPDAFVAALEIVHRRAAAATENRVRNRHEILQLSSDAVRARRSRRDRRERLGLGDVLQQPLRPGKGRRALSRLSRPDGIRRPARLRRRLPQRASSDRLRHDADTGRDRRRAVAQRQARQDRDPRPRAAAHQQSADHRRRIRHARQHHAGPVDRRLRARHRRRISCRRASIRRNRRSASPRRTI